MTKFKCILIVVFFSSHSIGQNRSEDSEGNPQGKYSGEYMLAVAPGQFKWIDSIFR